MKKEIYSAREDILSIYQISLKIVSSTGAFSIIGYLAMQE
jgi:hypothetical protein